MQISIFAPIFMAMAASVLAAPSPDISGEDKAAEIAARDDVIQVKVDFFGQKNQFDKTGSMTSELDKCSKS